MQCAERALKGWRFRQYVSLATCPVSISYTNPEPRRAPLPSAKTSRSCPVAWQGDGEKVLPGPDFCSCALSADLIRRDPRLLAPDDEDGARQAPHVCLYASTGGIAKRPDVESLALVQTRGHVGTVDRCCTPDMQKGGKGGQGWWEASVTRFGELPSVFQKEISGQGAEDGTTEVVRNMENSLVVPA